MRRAIGNAHPQRLIASLAMRCAPAAFDAPAVRLT
jgi:hypothetical protein